MWYNEAILAQYFLRHYRYVDKVHLLLDTDTTDNTQEVVKEFSNVEVTPFTFPDMLDDELRFDYINKFIKKLNCDWLYVVDADEFIFCEKFEDPKVFLARQKGNLVYAYMYHTYRHKTEKNLNPSIEPIILQRRYGSVKCRINGFGDNSLNYWYNKPIVVKPETGIEYLANGAHFYKSNNNIVVCQERFIGVHWAYADANLAIWRRVYKMKQRQSKRNIELGQDIYKNETEEQIRDICSKMNNEPKLF
jgi:hypothetical protein